jgi:uncharacterized protein YndB with AHSA1/START domain
MPLQLSETRSPLPQSHALDDGPVLDCASLAGDPLDHALRIRARRVYSSTREELFAAWTRRAAWESWMRLRARSRATLAPYRGGAFRLELAEGPTIQVITGAVLAMRAGEFLSLSWVHRDQSDRASTIDVSLRDRHGRTELTLVHRQIASRREAAWLMRLWATVLKRLESYLIESCLDEGTPPVRRGAALGPIAARRPKSGSVAAAATAWAS